MINDITNSVNTIIEGSFFPSLPSGEGVLLTLSLDGIPSSLNNIIITDSNNSEHLLLFDDGNLEICDVGFDCP